MEDKTRYGDDGSPYDADGVPGYAGTYRVCVDCYGWLHYGPEDRYSNYREGYAGPVEVLEAVGPWGTWDAEGARTVWDPTHGEALVTWGFKTSPCQGCGDPLAGDRLPVDLYRRVPVPVTLTEAGRAEVEG